MDDVEELLYVAISNNDTDKIAHLIHQGADVNKICRPGLTTLGRAAQLGSVDFIKEIIAAHTCSDNLLLAKLRNSRRAHFGASLIRKKHGTSSSEDDDTFGVRQGLVKVTAENFNINTCDNYGRTALHYAAEQGHSEVLDLLLKAGSYVNAMDFEGMTPLYLAAVRGHPEAVRCLIKHGANVSVRATDKSTPLHSAASRGQSDIVKLLLLHGSKVDALDYSDRSPLYMAAQRGQKTVVEILLNKGATVNLEEIHGYTALCEAVWQGDLEIARLLVNRGARVTQSHMLLHCAVTQGNVELARLLLKARCVPNLRDDHGNTPLLLAARQGHLEMVELLLQHGANPNYPNSLSGTVPVHEAAGCIPDEREETFDRVVEALQRYGAKLNIESFTPGETPLLRAVVNQHPAIAAVLIRRGADPNLSSLFACPVDILTLARRQGYSCLVRLLVYAGLDLSRVTQLSSDCDTSDTYQWLMRAKRNPLSLACLSRKSLRNVLGERVTSCVNSSSLPTSIKRFILLQDL